MASKGCQLCERLELKLTRHHLIPKSLHNRHTIRRNTTIKQRQAVIQICRPCHSQIHRLYSEKELAQNYDDLALLKADPAIQRFIAFIHKQKPDFKPRGHRRRLN